MRAFVFLSSMILLSSCQSANRAALLDESVRSYTTALRRQDNEMALQYVMPEIRSDFFEGLRLLDRYSLSDIRVTYVSPAEDLSGAVVTLAIEYFSPTGMELYQVQRFLKWQYHQDLKRWFLTETHPLGQTRAQSPPSSRPPN